MLCHNDRAATANANNVAVAQRGLDIGLVPAMIATAAKTNHGNQSSATDGRSDCQRSAGLDARIKTSPTIDADANVTLLCQRRPRTATPAATAVAAAMRNAIPIDCGVTA